MKTKEEFIKHLTNDYFISRYVGNELVKFEIFNRYNNTFVTGVFMSDNYCALIINKFLTHPDFNHLFTADIIKELVINNKIKKYINYELTQNC